VSECAVELVPGRECGNCTMCCKLIEVREIAKPRNQWCKHCTPKKGCGIYQDRPSTCREWYCGWRTLRFLSDAWFPAKCGMVVNPVLGANGGKTNLLDVHVDPWKASGWQEHEGLRKLARAGLEMSTPAFTTQVTIGEDHWLMLPDGPRGPKSSASSTPSK
jgi:hypothetical protein